MLAARQIGSRGTDTTMSRRATRAISTSAAIGSGTCSRTSMASTRSKMSSGNGSRAMSANAPRERCAEPMSGELGVGKVEADHAGAQASVAASRLDTSPSPTPTSRTDSGVADGSSASRAEKKPVHEPALDRVLRGVLVVGVPGRDVRCAADLGRAVRRRHRATDSTHAGRSIACSWCDRRNEDDARLTRRRLDLVTRRGWPGRPGRPAGR